MNAIHVHNVKDYTIAACQPTNVPMFRNKPFYAASLSQDGDNLTMKSFRLLFLTACTVALVGWMPATGHGQILKPDNIKLLSRGKAPRKALRYKLKPGQAFNMTITMHMNMKVRVKMGNNPPVPQAVNIPPLKLVNQLRVKARKKNGDMVVVGKMLSAIPIRTPQANPMMLAALGKELKKLKGLSMRYLISPTGLIKTAKALYTPRMSPQFKQLMDNIRNSLRQFVTPLPKATVGKGAKWKVVYTVKQPILVTQTTSYTVQQLGKDLAALGVVAVQSAKSQMRKVKTARGILQLKMSLNSRGTGRSVLRFRRLFINANLHILSDMKVKTKAKKAKQTVRTKMNIKTYIRSRKAR